MRWIALSERKPTAEDGDGEGRLLVRYQDGWIQCRIWSDRYWIESVNATHFARIRDIELPSPPAPAMPERLEFVKAKPGEIGDKYSICLKDTLKAFHGCDLKTQSNYTLYRRVEPGKRIVLEVVGPGVPRKGEWVIAEDKTRILTARHSYEETRTILRLVEGEEYLR